MTGPKCPVTPPANGSGADAPPLHKAEWEASYGRHENFLFYPHEEVIRFTARHVCRRTGLDRFEWIEPFAEGARWLDLGCGLGRHVVYGRESGCDAHGVDLSETAVTLARQWAVASGMPDAERRIVIGHVGSLPWPDDFFDIIVSHAVLDSMPFAVARQAVREARRVLRPAGLFYCDLIADEAADEQIVQTRHEQGTIQSYFNETKIAELVADVFDAVSLVCVRRQDISRGATTARYHLVLR